MSAVGTIRTRVALLVVTCLLVFTVTVPHLGSCAEQPTIGYIVKTMDDPWFQMMEKGAAKAASDLGAKLLWASPQKQGEIAEQIRLVEDMTTRKVSALILVPMTGESLVAAVRKANAAKIPVLNVDTKLAAGDTIGFVAIDDVEAGYLGARHLVNMLGGKGEVLILEGARGQSTGEKRLKGNLKALEGTAMKVVASQATNWERINAVSITENILLAHPDLAAIIGCDDNTTMGAIQVLKRAGKRPGDVKVASIDAIAEGVAAVRDGWLTVTVDNPPFLTGYTAVELAMKYLMGEQIPREHTIPIRLITEGNWQEAESVKYAGLLK